MQDETKQGVPARSLPRSSRWRTVEAHCLPASVASLAERVLHGAVGSNAEDRLAVLLLGPRIRLDIPNRVITLVRRRSSVILGISDTQRSV